MFQRRAGGIDSWGRHGGFSAHILSGLVGDLPTALTSTWFDAPFWLANDEELGESTDLPVMTLEQIGCPEPPPVDHELQRRLLAALLSSFARRQRIAFVGACDVLAETMAAVAAKVPTQVLAAVTFSSYEPAATAGRYDITGVCDPNDVPPTHTMARLLDGTSAPPGPALDLADAFLDGTALGDDQISAALEASTSGAQFSFRRLAQIYQTLRVLGSATPPNDAACATLISHIESARLLVADAEGRAGLGIALAAEHPGTWAGLRKTVASLSSTERDRVARATAEALVKSPDSVSDATEAIIMQTRALSAGMAETLMSVLLSAVAADASLAVRLGRSTNAALLQHAAVTGTGTSETVELLLEQLAPSAISFAGTDDLPDSWRADLLHRGWRHGVQISRIVVLLQRDGDALTAPLAQWLTRRGDLRAFAADLSRSAPPDVAVELLGQLQRGVVTTNDIVLLLQASVRLSSSSRQLQLMEQAGVVFGRRQFSGDDGRWLGLTTSNAVAEQLSTGALQPTREPLQISRGLRRLLDATAAASPESATWIFLADAVPLTLDRAVEVSTALHQLPEEQRYAAAVLAYHHGTTEAYSSADLRELFHTLFRSLEHTPEVALAILLAGYRPRYGAPPRLLRWSFSLVLDLADSDEAVQSGVRGEEFRRYWTWLATELSGSDRDVLASKKRGWKAPSKDLVSALAPSRRRKHRGK